MRFQGYVRRGAFAEMASFLRGTKEREEDRNYVFQSIYAACNLTVFEVCYTLLGQFTGPFKGINEGKEDGN